MARPQSPLRFRHCLRRSFKWAMAAPAPAPLPDDEVQLWAEMQRGLAERRELLDMQLEHVKQLRKEKEGECDGESSFSRPSRAPFARGLLTLADAPLCFSAVTLFVLLSCVYLFDP